MASLTIRSGVLGRRLALHLLSRATYNVTPPRIDYFATLTATQAVDELFDPNGSPPVWPDGPVDDEDGPVVPMYSDSDFQHEPGIDIRGYHRMRSITQWVADEAMAGTTAKWKIIHYFSSIFSVKNNFNVYYFHYWRLLEKMAFVDLKTLASKITYDYNMSVYLSNYVNRKTSPNENYAREFLELFTIQKGPQISPGNYTNYTESDISEAARVLTGIFSKMEKTYEVIDMDTGIRRAHNIWQHHDTGNKTFSAAFQNRTIVGRTTNDTMDDEVQEFVDMVFEQIATAKSYVRKMYHFFVSDVITTEVETDIITPLATKLFNNGYDHVAVMKDLFKSIHFYDEDDADSNDEIIGGKIKSPYELLFLSRNLLEAEDTRQPPLNYHQMFTGDPHYILHLNLTTIGLDVEGPPTVEGYPGWNDDARSRHWFSSNYLHDRLTFGYIFKTGRSRGGGTLFYYKTDMVDWVIRNIDLPGSPGTIQAPIGAADANYLINEMLSYMMVKVPKGDRLCFFQKQLLGGLSTVNWYTVWSDYLQSGNDTDARIGIERLYDAIMSSLEFQSF